MGATGVPDAVPGVSLPGILLAYSESVDHVLYITTSAASGAFLFALGMGWVNTKMKEGEEAAGTAPEERKALSSATAIGRT